MRALVQAVASAEKDMRLCEAQLAAIVNEYRRCVRRGGGKVSERRKKLKHELQVQMEQRDKQRGALIMSIKDLLLITLPVDVFTLALFRLDDIDSYKVTQDFIYAQLATYETYAMHLGLGCMLSKSQTCSPAKPTRSMLTTTRPCWML